MSTATRPDKHSDLRQKAAFYTVVDHRYFLGAVALINSIRLVGHEEPVVVVDAGLTSGQRSLLAAHVELVPASSNAPPTLLKPTGMLASPADVMFFLDSDVIVIRNLRELMETVAAGKIVVFEDGLATRTYPEWSTILGTPPIRQRTYVNFGHFGIPYRWFTKLIPMLRDIAERIDARETFVGFGKHEHPLYFADQDVFNALLASLVPASAVVTLPFDYAPHWPFGGVSIVDARSLACRSRGGLQPFLLHNILNKPWLVPTRRTVYSDLLARLLSGDDLAVRIPSRLVPIRFRYSRLSRADQWRADASSWLRVHIGKPGVRTYVQRRRAFRASR